MLGEAFKLALRTVIRNALRSFLTILGIVIGVGSVIAMVTIGNGTTAKVSADLAKLGSNLLFVSPGQWGPGRASAEARAFNAQDIAALRSQLRGIRAVAPIVQTSAIAIFGSESRTTTIAGTDNAYFVTQDWAVGRGRQFFEGEIRSGRAACVIGDTVRRELFGGLDPVGRNIRIKGVSCEVVGLLQVKGQSSFGTDQDDVVLMPLRAVQRRIVGNSNIARAYVSAADGVDTGKVQADIERLLRERRRIAAGQDDDFTVRDMRQILETQTATTGVLTALLGAVAAVSLLVGGIGIMNIMLVSVTERTREIGLRLAIGAQEAQVLTQFLVEAVVLSVLGGLIGILVGLGLAGVATAGMRLPFILDPVVIAFAFGFSAAVGVVFGYFRRAGQLK